MVTCINLKEQFGNRYKMRITPGYEKFKRDPWNFEILCKFGVIYPHGDDQLGFVPFENTSETPIKVTRNAINRATEGVMGLPCLISREESSDPKNLLFCLKDFRQIAKIVKPRRKKSMSEAHKRALLEGLRNYQETHHEDEQE